MNIHVYSRLRRGLAFGTRTRGRLAALVAAAGLLAWGGWAAARAVLAARARADAEAALAAYDFPTARARLDRAAGLRPGRPAVWLLAAQAARRAGDPDAARAHLARYEKLAGLFTPAGKLEATLQRVQAGDYERDVGELIARADADDPATEQILEALAAGSIQVYRLDRAGFWVHHLLGRFPKNPTGRLIRVRMDDILGRREQAADRCRELVADFPNDVPARLLLAGFLLRAQDYPAAAAEYAAARRTRPADPAPMLGLAKCFERMGRRDEARPLMAELEARFADKSDVLLECAKFATAEGRDGDAERLLRRANELAPEDHEVHYQLGLCLERQGNGAEAKDHFARFKQLEADLSALDKTLQSVVKFPQDPAPRREAARICMRNGQPAEALRWLHGALAVAPDDKATHAALADYYSAQADPERAQFHRAKAEPAPR